jgi:hypothetical protein
LLAFSQVPQSVTGERLHDRIAIERAIESLNNPFRRSEVFAREGDGPARYAELRRSTPAKEFRILGPNSGVPVVTISHEPWGEADIRLPHDLRSGILFIGPDVALSEGGCSYQEAGGSTRRKPLLFVLKRDAGAWKIASLRLVAREGVFAEDGR